MSTLDRQRCERMDLIELSGRYDTGVLLQIKKVSRSTLAAEIRIRNTCDDWTTVSRTVAAFYSKLEISPRCLILLCLALAVMAS